jgi:sensor c-di-GMP phosphodiesterase-like protein
MLMPAQNAGHQIALDDFDGLSSWFLHRFPIDSLKIDCLFNPDAEG